MCRRLGPMPWLATQALYFVGDGVQVEFSSVNLFLLNSFWIELHTNISSSFCSKSICNKAFNIGKQDDRLKF